MKDITVSELKANLSRYLRMAARGSRIVVKDRNDPIAQLGPLDKEPLLWQDRLAREGRLRLGSQDWVALAITKLDRPIPIQAALLSVREEPSEVRRR